MFCSKLSNRKLFGKEQGKLFKFSISKISLHQEKHLPSIESFKNKYSTVYSKLCMELESWQNFAYAF